MINCRYEYSFTPCTELNGVMIHDRGIATFYWTVTHLCTNSNHGCLISSIKGELDTATDHV